MNDLLQLKGHFESRKNNMKGGRRKLPSDGYVKLEKMEKLLKQLQKIREFWAHNTIIEGALVSVHYNRIIAKSNRISAFLLKVIFPELLISLSLIIGGIIRISSLK